MRGAIVALRTMTQTIKVYDGKGVFAKIDKIKEYMRYSKELGILENK